MKICIVCWKIYLHSATVTLLSGVQHGIAAARPHGDGLDRTRFVQAVWPSSRHELRELLHAAAAEELRKRLTSRPMVERRDFRSLQKDSVHACSFEDAFITVPELFCHHTVPTAVRGTTDTAWSIMGQAKVMSHLMSNGGGEANRIFMVVLEEVIRGGSLKGFIFSCKYKAAVNTHT